MKPVMDRAGRLTKEIRREAQLASGVPLEVKWREAHIEIEPAPAAVRLQRRGRLFVAVPPKKTPSSRSVALSPRARRAPRQTRSIDEPAANAASQPDVARTVAMSAGACGDDGRGWITRSDQPASCQAPSL